MSTLKVNNLSLRTKLSLNWKLKHENWTRRQEKSADNLRIANRTNLDLKNSRNFERVLNQLWVFSWYLAVRLLFIFSVAHPNRWGWIRNRSSTQLTGLLAQVSH